MPRIRWLTPRVVVSLHDQQSCLRWHRRTTARIFLLADMEQSTHPSSHQRLDGGEGVSTYLRRSEHHPDYSHTIAYAGEKGPQRSFGKFGCPGPPTHSKLDLTVQKVSSSHEPSHAVPSTDSRATQGHISDVDASSPSESRPQTPRGTGAADRRKQSEEFSGGDGIPASTRKDQRSVTLLPPILKKPRAGSQNQLPKTARVVSPAFDDSTDEQSGSDGSPSSSTLAAEPPTATSDPRAGSAASLTHAARPPVSPSSRVEKESLQRPSKKRTAFVANTASNRRRPNAVRRKSSQSSSSGASKVTSPRLAAQAQERSILELPRSSLPGKDDRRWIVRCDC